MVQKKISEVVLLEPLIKEAEDFLLLNLTCSIANKEYDFNVGSCRKFTVKARNSSIKFTFFKGQSNLIYILLADGISYNEDLIKPKNLTFYYQSASINAILEVIIWR